MSDDSYSICNTGHPFQAILCNKCRSGIPSRCGGCSCCSTGARLPSECPQRRITLLWHHCWKRPSPCISLPGRMLCRIAWHCQAELREQMTVKMCECSSILGQPNNKIQSAGWRRRIVVAITHTLMSAPGSVQGHSRVTPGSVLSR
jgi:hypothetical protein